MTWADIILFPLVCFGIALCLSVLVSRPKKGGPNDRRKP